MVKAGADGSQQQPSQNPEAHPPSAMALARDALLLVAKANPLGLASAAALQTLGALAALAVVTAGQATLDGILKGPGHNDAVLPGLMVLALATAVTSGVGTAQWQDRKSVV